MCRVRASPLLEAAARRGSCCALRPRQLGWCVHRWPRASLGYPSTVASRPSTSIINMCGLTRPAPPLRS